MRAISAGTYWSNACWLGPRSTKLYWLRRDRRVERQILLGLQIEPDAGHVGDFLLHAAADFLGARASGRRAGAD